MPMGRGKTRVISDITIDADLDFSGDYQVKKLAEPADDEALRKGNKDISNDEIADAAEIAYEKLDLYQGIVNLDIAPGANIALSKLQSTVCSETEAAALIAAQGLTIAETEVFSGTAPTSWTDLNLAGTVGAQATLVILKITNSATTTRYAVRKDGDTDEFYDSAQCLGCANVYVTPAGVQRVLIVATSDSGVIEWIASGTAGTTTIDVIGYIK